MDEIETIVIGAGVVGLAVAKAMSERGREVLVLEAESSFGMGISSRNSEVIHAGIYYPAGSLKAKTCVDGKQKIYEYLKSRQLPFKNTGKYIVATHYDQMAKLEEIKSRAEASGVTDLEWISRAQLSAVEPEVVSVGALWSPSTGILDSHSYMQSLIADIDNAGGQVVYQTPVERIEVMSSGFVVHTGGSDRFALNCKHVVNAASFGAHLIASHTDGLDPKHVPALYYGRGC